MESIEAVVFDLGGVVLGSPLAGIADYELKYNIPRNFVNVNVATRGKSGAFARLERGELALEAFYAAWKQELESPEQLQLFADFTKQPKLTTKLEFDTKLVFDMMMEKSLRVDSEFLHAIYVLRGSGIKVGALTNNFAPMDSAQPGSINLDSIKSLFDVMVESVVEGVRKPEPAAFELVCQRLGVRNKRNVVFLDDIGTNCKGAQAVGLETILVKLKDKRAALQRLQDVLTSRSQALRDLGFSLFPQPEPIPLFWNVGRGNVVGSGFGHGSHPPVLMLHGGGQTRHAWEKSARAVAAAGFFAITLDLKGHGDSYWDPREEYACTDIGLDVDQVLIRSGLLSRKPILIGASLGGLSSLCARESAKFGGLILVDISPKMEVAGVRRVLAFMKFGTEVGYASLEEAAGAVQVYTNRPTSTSNSLDGLKKNLRFDEQRNRYYSHFDPKCFSIYNLPDDVQVALYEEMERQVIAHAARLCDPKPVPVLLVRGQLTDIVGDDGVAALQAAVPQSTLVNVRGAGHMVAGDQNDAFTQAVLDFALLLKPELDKTIPLVEQDQERARL